MKIVEYNWFEGGNGKLDDCGRRRGFKTEWMKDKEK